MKIKMNYSFQIKQKVSKNAKQSFKLIGRNEVHRENKEISTALCKSQKSLCNET